MGNGDRKWGLGMGLGVCMVFSVVGFFPWLRGVVLFYGHPYYRSYTPYGEEVSTVFLWVCQGFGVGL